MVSREESSFVFPPQTNAVHQNHLMLTLSRHLLSGGLSKPEVLILLNRDPKCTALKMVEPHIKATIYSTSGRGLTISDALNSKMATSAPTTRIC